jgi:ribosomal protein L40E
MTEHASHCGKCGAALTPGVKFCEVCGQPVRPTVCAQCGARLAPEVKFCEVCGSPVGGPAAAPPLARPIPAAAPPDTEWERPAIPAQEPRPRKRRTGCLWILLILVLLLIAAAVAFWAMGWVVYNGDLIFFPNGLPFVATPVP